VPTAEQGNRQGSGDEGQACGVKRWNGFLHQFGDVRDAGAGRLTDRGWTACH
jgi:hypothetical protein